MTITSTTGYFDYYTPAAERDLTGLRIEQESFPSKDFSNCNLTKAFFKDVGFEGTSFSGANLSGAVFDDINAKEADFTGANTTNAVFVNINLTDAIITVEQLARARYVGYDVALPANITRQAVETKRRSLMARGAFPYSQLKAS